MMRKITTTICAATLALAFLGTTGVTLAQAQFAATVGQKDRVFSQEQVTVRAGQEVQFVNDDTVSHSIVVREPSGTVRTPVFQKLGEQSPIPFERAGEYDIRCAIHPKMRMTVQAQ